MWKYFSEIFRLIVIVILRETVGTNEAFDARTYHHLYLVSDKLWNAISRVRYYTIIEIRLKLYNACISLC